ncbi:MAG: hypothetical protein ACK554_02175, partial [Erythrobacteraceae bacterium]
MEPNNGSRRKPSSGRNLLLAVLAAFLAGGALAGWVMWNTLQSETTGTAVSPQAAKAPGGGLSPSPTPLAAAIKAEQAVERVAEQQGGLDQRLAAAEQRLSRLDLQAQAAAG